MNVVIDGNGTVHALPHKDAKSAICGWFTGSNNLRDVSFAEAVTCKHCRSALERKDKPQALQPLDDYKKHYEATVGLEERVVTLEKKIAELEERLFEHSRITSIGGIIWHNHRL